jgi:plastocyanin
LNYDSQAIVQPGGYSSVVIVNIYHSLATSGEPITLNATTPPGVTASFTPSSPVQLPAAKPLNVTVNLRASNTMKVGNYSISVKGVSGQYSQTANFTLRAVQYRVIMVNSAFLPAKLNVTQGDTVYWQNLDGPVAGCAGKVEGTGAHSVVFTTIPGANSSSIPQFGIYKYTFTTTGSFFYYSSLNTDHVMNATVVVAQAGGGPMGMTTVMPAFSHFKDGGNAAPTAAPTKTLTNNPTVRTESTPQISGGGTARSYSAVPGAHPPSLSILAFGAGPTAFIGFTSFGLALAILLLGARRLAMTFANFFARALPSNSP